MPRHFASTMLVVLIAACAGSKPPPARTAPAAPPPAAPDRRTEVLAEQRTAAAAGDPLFLEAFTTRNRALADRTPTGAQCAYLAVLLAPPPEGCDLRNPECPRPADHIEVVEASPPGPRFDHGCPMPPAIPGDGVITSPGTISISSPDASRLEGCMASARLWLLTRCP